MLYLIFNPATVLGLLELSPKLGKRGRFDLPDPLFAHRLLWRFLARQHGNNVFFNKKRVCYFLESHVVVAFFDTLFGSRLLPQ